MEQFPTPSFWEAVKTSWPWLWGISKLIWPVWVFLGVLIIITILKWKAEKFIDQKALERVKKKCPTCAEWIPKEAKKCSHCGNVF